MISAITIDVETPQTPLLEGRVRDNLLDPLAGGHRIGCSLLMEELARVGLKGVFFVNVYEASLWGEAPLKSLCQKIASQGHEVGLHTHPAPAYDRARRHMFEFSPSEQETIIRDGLAMLRAWLPHHPVASHRAGAYGLDEATIRGLETSGIGVDSSMFYGHPNCKVVWARNAVRKKGALWEVPVTGFLRRTRVSAGPVPLAQRTRFVKTDLDWASLNELQSFAAWAQAATGFMTLFLHSYSLMRFDANGSRARLDAAKLTKLREILRWMQSAPGLRVATFREMLDGGDLTTLADRADDAPTILSRRPLGEAMRRMLRRRA